MKREETKRQERSLSRKRKEQKRTKRMTEQFLEKIKQFGNRKAAKTKKKRKLIKARSESPDGIDLTLLPPTSPALSPPPSPTFERHQTGKGKAKPKAKGKGNRKDKKGKGKDKGKGKEREKDNSEDDERDKKEKKKPTKMTSRRKLKLEKEAAKSEQEAFNELSLSQYEHNFGATSSSGKGASLQLWRSLAKHGLGISLRDLQHKISNLQSVKWENKPYRIWIILDSRERPPIFQDCFAVLASAWQPKPSLSASQSPERGNKTEGGNKKGLDLSDQKDTLPPGIFFETIKCEFADVIVVAELRNTRGLRRRPGVPPPQSFLIYGGERKTFPDYLENKDVRVPKQRRNLGYLALLGRPQSTCFLLEATDLSQQQERGNEMKQRLGKRKNRNKQDDDSVESFSSSSSSSPSSPSSSSSLWKTIRGFRTGLKIRDKGLLACDLSLNPLETCYIVLDVIEKLVENEPDPPFQDLQEIYTKRGFKSFLPWYRKGQRGEERKEKKEKEKEKENGDSMETWLQDMFGPSPLLENTWRKNASCEEDYQQHLKTWASQSPWVLETELQKKMKDLISFQRNRDNEVYLGQLLAYKGLGQEGTFALASQYPQGLGPLSTAIRKHGPEALAQKHKDLCRLKRVSGGPNVRADVTLCSDRGPVYFKKARRIGVSILKRVFSQIVQPNLSFSISSLKQEGEEEGEEREDEGEQGGKKKEKEKDKEKERSAEEEMSYFTSTD